MQTHEMMNLFSGFLIGDGNIQNGSFRGGQVYTHKDYVLWQKEQLENLTSVRLTVIPEHVDSRGIVSHEFWSIVSRKTPLFETLYDRWYFNGRKTISIHDVKNFGWQQLATWFMDDGCAPVYTKELSRNGNMSIATHSFSEAEHVVLQRILYENFGLPFDVRRNGKYRHLFLKKRFSGDFYNGVKPFILPSFQYKLRTIDPESDLRI